MKNYIITVNGVEYEVSVEEVSGGAAPVTAAPAPKPAPAAPAAPKAAPAAPKAAAPAPKAAPAAPAAAGSVKITAGAAGKIFKVEAGVGQAVKAGDPVVILEAMKMEIPVVAPQDGTVASIDCKVGDSVNQGAVLATLN